MAFLSLIASLTQRATVVSEQVLDYVLVPPFTFDDNLIGEVIVVEETGDPTAPTRDVAIDSSNGVALTDGKTVVYANSIIMPVSDVNKVNFTMVVNSDILVAALAATNDDTIPAFLEVRIVKDSQDILLLREPVVIQAAATTVGPLPPAGVRGVLYYNLVSLRDDPNSLESLSTLLPAPLPTLTFLIAVIQGSVSFWQLVTGTADPDNPDGEVQPLDTASRFWAKTGGL
jgi:hypothetical protein